jgi:hypothetical protein
MSFFTSTNNRPSFFGLSQKPSASVIAAETTQIPLIQQPEVATQKDPYFSFGKFSLSSFTNQFTESENVPIESNSMDISSHDDQQDQEENSFDPLEEQREDPITPLAPNNEDGGLSDSVEAVIHQTQCQDVEQSKEKEDSFEKKEKEGDRFPSPEPKRVKFSTPKLLTIPLKLSASTHSPKQHHRPEPSISLIPNKLIVNDFRENLSPSNYLPSISEESGEQMSQGETGKTSGEKSHARYDSYTSTATSSPLRSQSSLLRSNPVLPKGDDSCEVIVERMIEVEKLIENGTNLSRKVEEKLDISIFALLDQRFRSC